MNEQSRFAQSAEQIVAEFFETGQDAQLHTLQLKDSISVSDKPAIQAAISAVDGVKKIHVDSEHANVRVISSGPINSVVNAVEKAGYEVATAH